MKTVNLKWMFILAVMLIGFTACSEDSISNELNAICKDKNVFAVWCSNQEGENVYHSTSYKIEGDRIYLAKFNTTDDWGRIYDLNKLSYYTVDIPTGSTSYGMQLFFVDDTAILYEANE